MKSDVTFTFIHFDSPTYHKHYGLLDIPVEFHAFLKPTSIGRFTGVLRYDGQNWDLLCDLLENSAKVTFHKREQRKEKMIESLLNSIEFLEIKALFEQIIDKAGKNFKKTVQKWQKRIDKMLEHNKLYLLVNLSPKANEFLINSTLQFAKIERINTPVLVFKHPEMNWILRSWGEGATGFNLYKKMPNNEGANLIRKFLCPEEVYAINRLVDQGYYKLFHRAAEEIVSEIADFCFAESAKTEELYPSLVKRRLVRSLMNS